MLDTIFSPGVDRTSVRRLKRVDYQPLADKAAGKIKGWWGRNITQAGKLTLTKAVLSSLPVYFLTVMNAPQEILEDLDKQRKKILWAADQCLTGGKCKVNWPTNESFNGPGWIGSPRSHKIRESALHQMVVA